ncbi:lateral signaling target protein 2 homolog isoform X2 [Anopheles stephensi]|uniref:lateral signaling target protein 2 homolog isoform X2 n=1 Tax=Anopheles stephensi TaxID=30069 RepID=UPI001658B3C6|nr:lateral signaling target protein 2 homolog isoform X2 [Anopheles stephensi]
MLGISKKPGPPVPPRPSAAAVATALAKQRENSPSPNGGTRGCNGSGGMVGMATLKPPHPGRTVVYKSPDFDPPQARNRSNLSTFGGSVPEQLQGSPNPSAKRNAIYHDSPGQSPVAMERKLLTPTSGGVMYRSTCSIVEINTSPSTSGSSSVSTSPVATLQKQSADQKSSKLQKDSLGEVAPVARRRMRNGDSHSSEGCPESSEVIIINGGKHGSSISLMSGAPSLESAAENGRGKALSECDSGTERGDSSGSCASAGSTLERENNAKNLVEGSSAKSSHFTEIIIGSNQSSTVVRSGSKPNIATTANSVIRSNSIRVPIKAAGAGTATPLYHRPEPEGGEHVQPSSDHRTTGAGVTTGASVTKSQSTTTLDPATLDSKLSEKKIAFHELLISELTAMRQKQQQKDQDHPDRQKATHAVQQESSLKGDEPTMAVDLAKINRRQRIPSERRSSGSETETTPNGTATRLPKIRTADWIEVGDNGKQVVLSSCQISLEDSGMEDEEKLDDASSGVGDSWDSVKEDAEERIIMSLPGLPPLPKSLSGFDLAGIQFQSHHQHHHHQHPASQQHNPHYPPTHHQQQQSATIQSAHHHHQMQPQSFHGTSPHPSSLPPSSQSPAAGVLNHHHTNPFIPIGSGLMHGGDSLASLESQQRGHSPVSSTLSGGSSGGRKASPQPPGSGPASTSTLDTQLAILRREMVSVAFLAGDNLNIGPVLEDRYVSGSF